MIGTCLHSGIVETKQKALSDFDTVGKCVRSPLLSAMFKLLPISINAASTSVASRDALPTWCSGLVIMDRRIGQIL
jgi:hypothetical protein